MYNIIAFILFIKIIYSITIKLLFLIIFVIKIHSDIEQIIQGDSIMTMSFLREEFG